MADFTKDKIYTYIRSAIKAVYPSMYVTGGYEPVPPQGPAVQIHEIHRHRVKGAMTLDGLDEQMRIAFDVNVYSNLFDGAPNEAYAIMGVAEEAFRELYFIETECRPVELANNRVTRLVARFERHLGSGDQMPTGATGST